MNDTMHRVIVTIRGPRDGEFYLGDKGQEFLLRFLQLDSAGIGGRALVDALLDPAYTARTGKLEISWHDDAGRHQRRLIKFPASDARVRRHRASAKPFDGSDL